MDNRYYESVIKEMKPFFDENGFKAMEDGSYLCETKAARIEYEEAKQVYSLLIADVEDGNVGEYSQVTSWLFDDSQNEKDAEAVGIDFVDTLRKNMGIKVKRSAVSGAAVDLPTASKGSSMDIAGFTKKVLDIFPVYKEEYKMHVAKYGNFLYMEFFAGTLIPQIKAVLSEGSKKPMKKLYDMLETAYTTGDRETSNMVVAAVSAAVCEDDELKARAMELLSEDNHLKNSVSAFIPVLLKDKKLSEALLK
ncbi:MAG: hypothetical protein IJZ75_07395 [Clostridia bacterium]|nr:hypothetical protein [Clostridia bacterium]